MRLRSTYAGVTSSGESVVRISPSFLSASTDTDGTKVVLTYNKTLSTTTASVSAFAVTTASAANAVTAVAVVGATVELTLTTTVQNDQAVTVAYTDPSGVDDANAIQDSAGNDAPSLAATSVTNISSVAGTAPVFQSAVTNTAGTKIILTYDEALSTTTAATSTFSVTSGGSANAVTAVAVSGSTIELTLTNIINDTQSVSFTYTDPSGADDTNAIQDFAGNDAASLTSTSVTNNSTVDGTPPVFQSAATTTDGTKVILTYDEALSATTAGTSTFAVTSGGSANAVTAVAVSGSTVELTLTNVITDSQSVSFTYTDPSGSDDVNAIQDTAGNDAATLASTSVTNNSTVDGTPPSFQSASTNTLGTLVIMTYDEALSTTTAAPSAFAVTTAGVNNDVTAVAVSGSTVELTLTTIVQNDQSVTVAYTDPSGSDDGNAIQDTTGNDAATLASTAVTNISTVTGTAPVFQSAASNSSGTKVILTYNETLSATAADTSTFAVTVDSSANAVTAVTNVGSTVELTLTSVITSGQSITVAYTDPSGSDDVNAIQDTAGNDAATLASTSVSNNSTVDVTPPTPVSASVPTDGSRVDILFNEALNASNSIPISALTVSVDGTDNPVTAATRESGSPGTTVQVTVTNTINSGQTVTISYVDPTAGNDTDAIEDASGNDVASFTNLAVTNNSTQTSGNTCTWSMRYHMYGENMGTFEVYVEQSGSFTRILQKIGEQHTSESDEYDSLTYDLMPSFAGQNIRIYCIQKHEANASFRGDVAIDDLKITTNGTVTNLSGNFTKWQEGGEHSTLSSAQTSTSWSVLNTTLDNRTWNIDPGGTTVSSNTGPDMAFDNDIFTDYIYWEASVTGQTLSTTKYYPLRTTDVISVPS